MKPTIGRIVHFHHGGADPLAAIITQVWSDTCVNLTVFHPDLEPSVVTSVTFEGMGATPYWCWPPRDDG